MSIRRLMVAAMTALVAGIAISSSIAAEPDSQPYPPELDPAVVNAIVRDLGLTPEQIQAYGAKARQAHFDLPRIREFLGDLWGGGYLHRREDNAYEVVVATTDSRMEQRIREMNADRVVVVRYSLRELEEARDRLMPAFIKLASKGLSSIGADPTVNRIIVRVKRGSEAVVGELAATSNVPIEMLKVESLSPDSLPVPTRTYHGGEPWSHLSLLPNFCTAGFAVNAATTKGMLTAGHCIPSAGAAWLDPTYAFPPPVGTFLTRQYGILGDHAWAVISNPAFSMAPTNPTSDVKGNWKEGLGVIVCKSGAAGGGSCGSILAVNQGVVYSDGVALAGMTLTSACAIHGDSGGPFLTPYGEAQGIVSGGQTYCGFSPYYSFFQPLQDAINTTLTIHGYNVFLRTVYDDRRVTAGYQLGGTGDYALPNLFSPNGAYRLAVDNSNGWITLFHFGTPAKYFQYVAGNGVLMMQTDGNVTARDATGALVWQMGIAGTGNGGSEMRLSDIGELKTFDHTGNLRRSYCIVSDAVFC